MNMKKQALWFTAIMTTGLIACGSDDVDLSNNPASDGVQEPGSSNVHRGCATRDLPQAELDADAAMMARFDDTAYITASHVIPVYWHSIRSASGGGGVTTQQISDSIAVLNAAYAGSSFSFQLTSTDFTNNDAWYTCSGGTCETQMKTALRQGGVERPQHLLEQHGRRPARLGDVPVELRRQPEERRRRDPAAVAPRRQRRAVQPRRHARPTRSATGWASITRSRAAAPQAPATGSATRRPRSRAAFGCPTGRNTCTGTGIPGNDPITELHGLHGRLLHEPVHGGPEQPHGRAVDLVPLS